MSYTPGPWSYDDKNNFPPAILDSDDNLIASIPPEWVDGPEANAHLIAAAPDLLAACEALLAAIHEFEEQGFDVLPTNPDTLWYARDIIAKARGQAVPA